MRKNEKAVRRKISLLVLWQTNHPDQAISFLRWCMLAVPFGFTCLIAIYVYIVLVIKPDDVSHVPEIVFKRVGPPRLVHFFFGES